MTVRGLQVRRARQARRDQVEHLARPVRLARLARLGQVVCRHGEAIPSGQTVTGNVELDGVFAAGDNLHSISLPGKAAGSLADTDINFSADAIGETSDDDAACSGSAANPTAPAGKVCLYVYELAGVDSSLEGVQAGQLTDQGFSVIWFMAADGPTHLLFTWAYRAP